MDQNPLDKLGGCPRCGGKGLGRNPKHFFYGICLIASGVMALFQWWPAPEVFDFIREIFVSLKLSPWFGNAIIWFISGVPLILGLVFMYAWLNPEVCPCQKGRRNTVSAP